MTKNPCTSSPLGLSPTPIDSFREIKKGKRKEIYDLIEEPLELEVVPNLKISFPKNKKARNKSARLFEGRNIIKKVKTHCLKIFYKAVKECSEFQEKITNKFRLKIHEKKNIYRIFKSDISKFRNKMLLNMSMKKIMKTFSNININENTKIKEEKQNLFNFLMNCNWREILYYVKRRNEEIVGLYKSKKGKSNQSEVVAKEINEYLNYIKNGTNCYKDRINLDKNYLKLYENSIRDLCITNKRVDDNKNDMNEYLTFNYQVQELIKNYEL